MKKGEQELRAMKSKIAEYEAALRTISNFGGTVQQARDLSCMCHKIEIELKINDN